MSEEGVEEPAADVLLHYIAAGAGPVVVLLHSTVADSRMWQPQIAVLSERHRAVAPDLRGFGATPMPDEPFCHAADVVRLIDRLGVDRFALIGSSGGGHVALQVASALPDRVRQVILLCPAADGIEPTPSLRARWADERALLEAGDLDGAARLSADLWLGPEADEAARAAVFAMQRQALVVQTRAGDVAEDDWPVDPDRLSFPVTIVIGGHDLDFFGAVGRYLVERLPLARLIELDWAGHLPNLERPAEVSALLAAELSDPGVR